MSSITYNGLDFDTVGFILSRDSFSQPAEPRFNQYNLTSANGAILQNTNWAPQIITVNGVLIGSSYSDKMSKYRQMLGYLYTTSVKSLIFDTEPTIEYLCKLASAPSITTLSEIAMEVQLEFICPKPGRDVTATTVTGTVGDFVCNCGDSNFYVYPTIEMTGLTSGVNVTIETPSTEDILWVIGWPGSVLVVTTEPGNKFLSSAGMQYQKDGSTYPKLLAFTDDQIIRISVSSGTASTTITYRNSYL